MTKLSGLEVSTVTNYLGMLSSFAYQDSFVPAAPAGDNSNSSGSETNFDGYSLINSLANAVIKSNSNMSPAGYDAPTSLRSDAPTINPVSQMLLNTLSITPDEQCFKTGATTTWDNQCAFTYPISYIYAQALGIGPNQSANDIFSASKNNNLIALGFTTAALGTSTSPGASAYPTTSHNIQTLFLPEVDSSVFLSPLVYNSNKSGSASTSYPTPYTGFQDTAFSQLSAAQAFLRNVTGNILPNPPPSIASLNKKLGDLTSKDIKTQLEAFKSLSKYILTSRVYTSQESVAYQNIYEIMSKRMPFNDQNASNSPQDEGSPANPNPSSQALNEFIMSTYRLFNPQGSNSQGQTKWQYKIASTSSLNVEREMALLLAELNSQIYLMRQQQERLVFTESLILLNTIRTPYLEESRN